MDFAAWFGYLGVYRCCFGVCVGDRLLAVGTGSEQRTAFQSKSKRLDELRLCSAILQEQQATGVFVSHCNTDNIPTIHESIQLLQQLPGSGNLYSFRDAVYGTYDKQGQFHQNRTISSRAPMLPLSEELNLLQPAPLLQLMAGVGGSLPEIPDGIQAIFYACYHSGTICTDASFQAFAAKAADRQIPIYLTGCRSDTLDYDTVKQWQALRVQPLYDIAPIAAYCKSWIQVSIGKSAKLI